MRISQNVAGYKKYKICILNGMYTDRLGVIEVLHNGAKISVTDIERTLIDIVVRPGYSGGVSEVLSAYNLAKKWFL
jgi:predicted transcriptional regulator of viral defense system